MDETKKLTPEELEVEKQELTAAQAQEGDVRAKIIEDYGFTEEDDVDKIDKLTAEKMESNKKLSSAIGQKIKQRERGDGLQTELDKNKPEDPPTDPPAETGGEDVDKKIEDKFEQRDLDDLDYPDELKEEIKKTARMKEVSIKEALKDTYIVFKVEEYEKSEEVEKAGITRTNKPGSPATSKPGGTGTEGDAAADMPEFDMTTEEGRKDFEDWKKKRIKEERGRG